MNSKAFGFLAILIFWPAAGLFAQGPATEEGRSRFGAVDIYVDSKTTPLAAYQLEFAATNAAARIVGIEGGGHPAFREPPLYDPKAMQHECVIIAAFSTEPPDRLPAGRTRVATIHFLFTGAEPGFDLKLQTTADSQGHKITSEAGFEQRKARPE